MKDKYFTKNNLRHTASQLCRAFSPDRPCPKFRFQPRCAALLVLDMQQFFLDESSHAFIPSAPAILPGLTNLASMFMDKHLPVVLTRHLNAPDDAGLMSRWWHDLIRKEDPLSRISPVLSTVVETASCCDDKGLRPLLIEKTQYDAFYHTSLQEILTAHAVTQLIITGVMTNLCCETTARSAFVRGFEVFFTVDGTATYNETLHRATLANLSFGFAELVCIKDVIATLEAWDAG